MTFLDATCDAYPLYFVGGSILLLAGLLVILIAVIAWPFGTSIKIDPDAEPIGDQPRMPLDLQRRVP